ncbi:MAG: caspase family protein [bacterium]
MEQYEITKNIERWAVVIGISEYQDEKINKDNPIKFADRDAIAFYKFLQSAKGGEFNQDHAQLLINKNATLQAIKEALTYFLARSKEDDLVIIYFAGHGIAEPDNPLNLFLLPYDTKPDIIRSTAFPMYEMNDVLQRYIKAKRVVIIADSCHSGGLKVSLTMRDLRKNLINKYINQLTKSREGVATITASRIAQLSQEGENWGGGHGVFTYYLLEGLEGKADGYLGKRDGIITVAEAYEYTRERVAEDTDNRQIPDNGGSDVDTEIPLAILETVDKASHEVEGKELYDTDKNKFKNRTEELDKDIDDTNKINLKILDKHIGAYYYQQIRSITLKDDIVDTIKNEEIFFKYMIGIDNIVTTYLLFGGNATTFSNKKNDPGVTYGGGLKLAIFKSRLKKSRLRIDLAGEWKNSENQSEKGEKLLFSRHIKWTEFEGNVTLTYRMNPNNGGIFLGIAYSKVMGKIILDDGDSAHSTTFHETDPLGIFVGTHIMFGRIQMYGEFGWIDIFEDKAQGPWNIISLGLGLRL